MRALISFAVCMAFAAYSLPATQAVTLPPGLTTSDDGSGVCIPPTTSQKELDAMNRLELYTHLVELAAKGDHQSIREACQRVPEALCTNKAMDFLQDANAIESLQNRPGQTSSRRTFLGRQPSGEKVVTQWVKGGNALIQKLNLYAAEGEKLPLIPPVSLTYSPVRHRNSLFKRALGDMNAPLQQDNDPSASPVPTHALAKAIKRGLQGSLFAILGVILLLLSAVYGLALGAVSCVPGAVAGICAIPVAVCMCCSGDGSGYGGKSLSDALGMLFHK